MAHMLRFALIATASAALALAGCGNTATEGAGDGTPDPAGSGTTTAQPPVEQPEQPEAPKPTGDVSNPMAWAAGSETFAYAVIPSIDRVISSSKKLANAAAPGTAEDNAEAQLLQTLNVSPKVLDTIDHSKPIVLVMTEINPKTADKEPPLVAVVSVKSAEDFRAALATPPTIKGLPPEEAAKRALKAQPADADGLFRFTRVERKFDFDAYKKAASAAAQAGKPEPNFDDFNTETEVTALVVAERGGLVLFSPGTEGLKKLLAADLAADPPAVPADDLLVWVDTARLREHFREDIEKGLAEMDKEMLRGTKRGAPPFAKNLVQDMGDLAKSIVRQSDGAELRVSLGNPAVRFVLGATFAPDGSIAKELAAQLHDGPDLVGLLPADTQLLMASRLRYTETMRKWGSGLFDGMLSEFNKKAPDQEARDLVAKFKALMEKSYAAVSGEYAMGMGLHREHGLWAVGAYRVTDPQAARDVMREGTALTNDLLKLLPPELAQQGLSVKVTSAPEALTHREVKLDRFELALELPFEGPEGEVAKEAFNRLFGGTTLQLVAGMAKDRMVTAFGRDAEDRARAMLDRILDGTTAGPAGDWAEVKKGLTSPSPSGLFYVAPLAMWEEGMWLAATVQATGCLQRQTAIDHAAKAYHTINGEWPRDLRTLIRNELLPPGAPLGCEDRYQIDPNSGGVSCPVHGTTAAPRTVTDPGEALGVPWKPSKGDGGFGYFFNVYKRGEKPGVEVGVTLPTGTITDIAKAFEPLKELFGGGGRRGPPMGMPDLSRGEMQALGTLRQVAMYEGAFRAQGVVDQDGDGRGEFGFLGELAGTEAPRGREAPLEQPLLPAVFGTKTTTGVVEYGGYCFRVFLPTAAPQGSMDLPKALGEPQSGLAKLANKDFADAQEQRWACYAWPAKRGEAGTKVFFVNQAGRVYMTEAMLAPYSGAAGGPEAHAALDAEGENPGNLSGEVAMAAQGMRAVDGNTWRPAGFGGGMPPRPPRGR